MSDEIDNMIESMKDVDMDFKAMDMGELTRTSGYMEIIKEPCEDCISRQAAQDYIAKYLSQYLYNDVREAVEAIDEFIGELPSVNPHETVTEFADRCRECGARYGKLLKQEPCEDAISKEAVLNNLNDELKYGAIVNASGIERACEIVNDMLPVIPQPKTGKWKRISMDKYVQHAMAYYKCSECGGDIIGEYPYCPNCGACMKDCRTLDEFIEDSKESEEQA